MHIYITAALIYSNSLSTHSYASLRNYIVCFSPHSEMTDQKYPVVNPVWIMTSLPANLPTTSE